MLRLLWLCLILLLGAPAHAHELVVDGRAELPLWPAVQLLEDPGQTLTLAEVLARREQMQAPTGTAGNLGRTASAMWLRVPLHLPGLQDVHRVLHIDYPPLNQLDVWLLQGGQPVQHARMGSQVPVAQRPLLSRAPAVALHLAPGDQELLIRVQTTSSMVLPMQLMTLEAFGAFEAREQLLLGVTLGLSLCMLIYSLSHWVSLRDPLFLLYAAMVSGNSLYFTSYFGIAQLYLWPDWTTWGARIAPIGILWAVACGSAFVLQVLRAREVSPWLAGAIRWIGIGALVTLVAGLLGLPYPALQTATTVLGVSLTAAAVPVTYRRARRGERAAMYMLVGWVIYVAGAVSVALLLRGRAEPSFWAQHLFLLSTMVEMATWMGVLGLRVQAIHRNADRARLESDALRTLAQTDSLTGLPNRRGLQERLQPALAACGPRQLLAVYLLDLDGFKPVNDRHGHDVGDALLVAVGQRLQAQLRGSDVVARLGGDEFVVLATGLADEATARALGQKMLAAFNEPFDVMGQRCEVGLTIGYALAPLDGTSGDDLIKRADAAMYAGKQAGRRQLQRGGRSMVAV